MVAFFDRNLLTNFSLTAITSGTVAGDRSYLTDGKNAPVWEWYNSTAVGTSLIFIADPTTASFYATDIFITNMTGSKWTASYRTSITASFTAIGTIPIIDAMKGFTQFTEGINGFFGHLEFPTIAVNAIIFRHPATNTTRQMGEIILTKRLFTLEHQPSKVITRITPKGYTKKLINSNEQFIKIDEVFSCDLRWDMLFGDATGVNPDSNSDLQNITQLAINKPSFMIWINDNNADWECKTYRLEDIYTVRPTKSVDISIARLNMSRSDGFINTWYGLPDFTLSLEETRL